MWINSLKEIVLLRNGSIFFGSCLTDFPQSMLVQLNQKWHFCHYVLHRSPISSHPWNPRVGGKALQGPYPSTEWHQTLKLSSDMNRKGSKVGTNTGHTERFPQNASHHSQYQLRSIFIPGSKKVTYSIILVSSK